MNRFIKNQNLDKQILEAFREKKSYIRSDLVKKIKYPRSTIYDHLKIMMNNGIITQSTMNIGKGRPNVVWIKV